MARPKRTTATGFITFSSNNNKWQSTALLGDGPATPTGGYGGWQVKARARNRGFTLWQGNDPMSIDIPILYDYFSDEEPHGGRKCEAEIRQLEIMAGVGMKEPPLIYFDSGGAVPYDVQDAPKTDWVIDDIQWGDVIRNTYGNRVRQAAVVKVMQFIDNNDLKISAAKHRRNRNRPPRHRDKPGAKHKIYTVKRGDTLQKIANHQLGDRKRWHEIARLNGIRDGIRLVPGQKIRLP
jgi:hypothetical protein